MEENSVWEAGPRVAVAAELGVLFCPSRRAPQAVTFDDHYIPSIGGGDVVHDLCDYAASNRDGTGIVRRFKPQALSRITDGLSHTLLYAEKRMNVARLGRPQEDDNEGYTAGWNSDTIRRTDKPPRPDFLGVGDGDDFFGSSHASVVNVVYGDGSVHSLGYDVTLSLFAQLGNLADGLAAPLEVALRD